MHTLKRRESETVFDTRCIFKDREVSEYTDRKKKVCKGKNYSWIEKEEGEVVQMISYKEKAKKLQNQFCRSKEKAQERRELGKMKRNHGIRGNR